MNERERAEFRAFVKANHPDRGGDPEAFVTGLARFHAAGTPISGNRSERVSPVPSASGADGPGDARFDVPVEVVTPPPLPVRVAVALIRTFRRRHGVRRVL